MLIIVTGASGVAKSYLCVEVAKSFDGFYFPKKTTTRPRRPDEGFAEYEFVDLATFSAMEKSEKLLVSIDRFGNKYGVSKAALDDVISNRKRAIIALDLFVAAELRSHVRDLTTVYLKPTDLLNWENYLHVRSQKYNEDVEARLEFSKRELAASGEANYIIPDVNAEFSLRLLKNIVVAEHLKPSQVQSVQNVRSLVQVTNAPRLAVDLVLFDEAAKRIGLIERLKEPLGWALPGGFVEYGESLEDAAVREATEETGITPRNLELIGCFSDPKRDPRMHVVSVAYVARVKMGGQAGSDAGRLKWFPLKGLPEKLAFDHAEILIRAKDLITPN